MNHYQQLGITPDAKLEEIRAAYRKAARATHPDHGGTVEEFYRIQTAWETLSDPTKRAHYDNTLQHPQPDDADGDNHSRNPQEETLLHQFIKNNNRHPGERPPWYNNPTYFGPLLDNIDPDSYQTWYQEAINRINTEDATYNEQLRILRMNPQERAAYDKQQTAAAEKLRQEQTKAAADQQANQPYWANLNKLPQRYSKHAPTKTTPGIPQHILHHWRRTAPLAYLLPILTALTLVTIVIINAHPTGAIILLSAIFAPLFFLPAAWVTWYILDKLIEYAYRTTPKITLQADLKKFREKHR